MLRTALRAAARAPASSGARGLATVKLPDLPYDFSALAPVVSGEIMQARHAHTHTLHGRGAHVRPHAAR
jgi:Fe-Mn family superoxide dismutase